MTGYILVNLLLLGGGLLLAALAVFLFEVEIEELGILAGVIALIAVIFGLFVLIGTPAEQAYGRSDCNGYSQQTGRVTKFVITTSLDGGTCMTKDANGRWINVNDLRAVAPQQP